MDWGKAGVAFVRAVGRQVQENGVKTSFVWCGEEGVAEMLVLGPDRGKAGEK